MANQLKDVDALQKENEAIHRELALIKRSYKCSLDFIIHKGIVNEYLEFIPTNTFLNNENSNNN